MADETLTTCIVEAESFNKDCPVIPMTEVRKDLDLLSPEQTAIASQQ